MPTIAQLVDKLRPARRAPEPAPRAKMSEAEILTFNRGLRAFIGSPSQVVSSTWDLVADIERSGHKVFIGPTGFPIILPMVETPPATARVL
jgi:hypothetical protein